MYQPDCDSLPQNGFLVDGKFSLGGKDDDGELAQQVKDTVPGDLCAPLPENTTARKILNKHAAGVAILEGQPKVVPIEVSFVQIKRSNDTSNSI